MIGWQWTGKESKTESSRGFYKLARVMPNIFVGMWVLLVVNGIVFWAMGQGNWLTALLFNVLMMGSLVWGIRYLSYRYVSVVKITPVGLEVIRGRSTTVHPWSTIGEIHTVPFVQPALWAVKFRDSSPTVAFFTEGSSWIFFGIVKAKSVLVDEIRRLAAEG